MTHTRPVPIVACLSGDGIGPEVMAEAGRVIDTAGELFGFRLRQVHLPFGGDAIDKYGDPFPSHVRAAVKASDSVLLGAVGGPRWETSPRRPEQGLLELRRELDTYANLRPVRHGDIDLMVVRELTGGLYFGRKELGDDNAMDVCSYTREQIERVSRWAFRLARRTVRPCRLGGQGERAGDVEAVAPRGHRAPRAGVPGDGADARTGGLVRHEPGDPPRGL